TADEAMAQRNEAVPAAKRSAARSLRTPVMKGPPAPPIIPAMNVWMANAMARSLEGASNWALATHGGCMKFYKRTETKRAASDTGAVCAKHWARSTGTKSVAASAGSQK